MENGPNLDQLGQEEVHLVKLCLGLRMNFRI
jgi:hypothetical protein